MISKLDIRPPDPRQAVGKLSGGNAQKVLLGKWLAGKPGVLVLHEPTQAVDVGARQDIITRSATPPRPAAACSSPRSTPPTWRCCATASSCSGTAR